MKEFNPDDPKSYTARTGWAMNVRRRVYDTLNVLYAADMLLCTKDDKFVLNPKHSSYFQIIENSNDLDAN